MQILMNVIVPLSMIALVLYGLYRFVARLRPGNRRYKIAVGLSLLSAWLPVWVMLGVGIFGAGSVTEEYMVMGVLAVGAIGAILSRFQPEGMARTLYATALATVIMAITALVMGLNTSLGEIFILCGVFTVMFLLSGWMFHLAALSERSKPEGTAEA